MRVSAEPDYVDWLNRRTMSDRDRSPCYTRLCSIFVACLKDEGMTKLAMPRPAWTH